MDEVTITVFMSEAHRHLAEVPAIKEWLENISHQLTLMIREHPELLSQVETTKH